MTSLAEYESSSDIVFRVAFSLIFVVGGLGHFVQHEHMLARLNDSPWLELVSAIGSPTLLLALSGATLLAGGVALLFGIKTRCAVALLFVTLVPITLTIHVAPGHVGPLLKNVAILGGLVHFFVRGPGAFSWDNRGKLKLTPAPGP